MPMPSRRRPMPHATRVRLGGLSVVAKRGTEHMAAIGRRGGAALDARIAREAGIPEDAPDYEERLKAARTAYYIKLSEARWGGRRSPR